MTSILRFTGILFLVLCAPAAADVSVHMAYGWPEVVIGPSPESSHLTVRGHGGEVTVHDPGTVLVSGRGCLSEDPHTVTCLNVTEGVQAYLGGGDDELHTGGLGPDRYVFARGQGGDDTLVDGSTRATLVGGRGADRLTGGGSSDKLASDPRDLLVAAGGGNDLLKTHGARAVGCGDGYDVMRLDRDVRDNTIVGPDCEWGWESSFRPLEQSAQSMTFRVRCSNGRRCAATLRLYAEGRELAAVPFRRPDGRPKLVTVAARHQGLVHMVIDGYRGGDYHWWVRL